MKKTILQLGRTIPKKQLQFILGGNDTNECSYGTCPNNQTCYQRIASSSTFCSSESQNFIATPVPEPTPKIQGPGFPRYTD
ncbi:hypothetical protein [uncultured Tenacibaculum sp.]|uniref:hypothetical protein n=1 Tax=uncultured Tenacibaculum sp. TaxID=174713 RepID=UPI0026112D68|nr:hypothetical protein [uncultured Tenacibaculum sp.]